MRRSRRPRALGFATVLVAAAGWVCKGGETDGSREDGGTGGGETEAGLARAAPRRVRDLRGERDARVPRAFRARAVALDEAVAALAADGTASRALAGGAFAEAMEVWQRMELIQFGPTGSSASVIGGQIFRDNIYGWPAFGRCAVEEAIADESYATPAFGSLFLVASMIS